MVDFENKPVYGVYDLKLVPKGDKLAKILRVK